MLYTITKDYTKFHRVVYQEKEYIFDPYQNGIGLWKEYTASGKAGKIVPKNLQLVLNELVFGHSDLPNMVERYKTASSTEKEVLTDIAVSWLQLKIKGIKSNSFEMQETITTNSFFMGQMHFYIYDAKWKNILPLWDRYPLMIPIKSYSNGVLGINLHYLDAPRRAVLLNTLEKEFGSYNEKELKLNISYDQISRISGILSREEKRRNDVLEKMSEFPDLKICIKRYLNHHVMSRKLIIEPHEWAYAIWLPIDEFVYLNKAAKKGF